MPDEKAELRDRLEQLLVSIKDDRIRHAIAARVTSGSQIAATGVWRMAGRSASAAATPPTTPASLQCPLCSLQSAG